MRHGRAHGFQPADRCPNSSFETAKSMAVQVVGTHAKRQSPSRVPAQGVANVAADEVPKHAFETAKSMEVPVVGTHPKRQSPSRIPAQPAKDRRPDRDLTYPLNPQTPVGSHQKTHLLGSHKIGTKSSRTDGWKHFQTVGLEKRKRRKQDSSPRGDQLWRQTGAQARFRNR